MANPIPIQDASSTRNLPKRQRLTRHHHHHHQRLEDQQQQQQQQSDLIPGLPDHVAQLCLSHVPPSTLYSVCHSWRRLIYSPSFPPFLSLYTVLSSTNSNTDRNDNFNDDSIKFFNFDPISSTWDLLPDTPPDPPLRLILRHPSFISRHLPIQSVTVSGNLILLAASTHNFYPAISRPLIFNPISRTWSYGPPLTTPRRWCATGTINNTTIYVASGIGSQYSADVAKLVEKWEFSVKSKNCAWRWEQVKGLKDGRFSREAIEAIGWRGKLCMVNVKGDAAKEGLIYDTNKDTWQDMPQGMLTGWKGPVAAMDEQVMYVVDEVKGALRKYDPNNDVWEIVMESNDNLKGAQQIAAGGGRVCVVCRGGNEIVVVDVVAVPVRLWTVDIPPGFEAVAVHILPRMSKPEFEFSVPLY